MYNALFWTKYLFRVLHISSLTILSGHIIWKYLFNQQNEETSQFTQWMLSIILIMSGFVNLIILDPKQRMKSESTFWLGVTHTKLISSILIITPILDYILDESVVLFIRFYFCIIWIFVSPFIRFYREYWTEYHQIIQSNEFKIVELEQL